MNDREIAGSALHSASQEGHLEVVEALLAAGIDVNAISSENNHALYLAIFKHHAPVVEALLAAKADPNKKIHARTPLAHAIQCCDSDSLPYTPLPPAGAPSHPHAIEIRKKELLQQQAQQSNARQIVDMLKGAGAKTDDNEDVRPGQMRHDMWGGGRGGRGFGGFARAGADIGVFVSVSDSEHLPSGLSIPVASALGAQWLMQPALPEPLPHPHEVKALVELFPPHPSAHSAPRPPLVESPSAFSCVSEAACVALRKLVDQAHNQAYSQQRQALPVPQLLAARNKTAQGVAAGSCEGDFKLLLSLQELQSIVGDDAISCILRALETDEPDAIALRRTAACDRWINFHTDAAARTVQVGACTSRCFDCGFGA